MEIQKKILTRVRLVNWHYFSSETIAFDGSALITGGNAAGKSTILDAIQLVLTTNTRKFNAAANEKGNRDLKGYVRGKLGNVGETYLRKNVVISNVALEFYEERRDCYFVLGVHMTSLDEESAVVTKWYTEECRLEDFSFLVEENRPATAAEFTVKGQKIHFIEQKNAAREQFKRKLGNLEDRFFEIIPKSLAFKPMDNVKEFINKFVLSDAKIDVEGLRENIETLSELEGVIRRSKEELQVLDGIVEQYEKVKLEENEINKNEILMLMTEIENLQSEKDELTKAIEQDKENLSIYDRELKQMQQGFSELDERVLSLRSDIRSNEASQLVETLHKQEGTLLEKLEDAQDQKMQLLHWLEDLQSFLELAQKQGELLLDKEAFEMLFQDIPEEEKLVSLRTLEENQSQWISELQKKKSRLELALERAQASICECREKWEKLKVQKLSYPVQTERLKLAIEEEFRKRAIDSEIYVLAELLEITDARWQNAVEGYFNTQKFYLVIEPQYYDIALEVYKRSKLHTAGLINTKRILGEREVSLQSLAAVVVSENHYAKAFSDYVLGRVMRCDHVEELENYEVAITEDVMLYQGYVVRKLDDRNYRNPYIGQDAYRSQISITKSELDKLTKMQQDWKQQLTKMEEILLANRKIKLDLIRTCINAPSLENKYREQLEEIQKELGEANNNPTLIDMQIKLDVATKERAKSQELITSMHRQMGETKASMEGKESQLLRIVEEQGQKVKQYERKIELDVAIKLDAEKEFVAIQKQYGRKSMLGRLYRETEKQKQRLEELMHGESGLMKLQDAYNYRFERDFMRGTVRMSDYYHAKRQLEKVEIVRFQEKVLRAKQDCEEIFKSDFLAKMKEQIQNAKNEFRSLDRALENVYYGEDSYHFKISYDKRKERLYRMIMSDKNMEGYHLWTDAFEEEYKEEMEELFEKLTSKENNQEKILEEYTDYRSYLDYDIEIHKKDGTVQKFSKIYGEKSGSETQVPYYVAIAASFYHLYRFGNTTRLMLLDEAFDKMDDERIASMMEFLNSLDLQVIMATPPAKIEVIGEKVDTVLTAIRVGKNSIVEKYA